MTARIILDVHALQNVPPSSINRDDTGAPKTAVYGGTTRARVSSQAWKRATRRYFDQVLDPSELGVRTKRVAEVLAERITNLTSDLQGPEALAVAAEVLQAATGSKIEPPKRKVEAAKKHGSLEPPPESAYLMFLSSRQLDHLAVLAAEGGGDIKAFLKDKEVKARARRIVDSRHSVDIALFGRMVADSTDISVDAAAQVAHALSVHRTEIESDYFTAVDDHNTDAEPGAGMIGTVDFNSATLYRYAALDVDLLERNLGKGLDVDQAPVTPVRRAVEAFLEAFVSSLPTGKISTFANHTLPDVVVVKLRATRPISFVSAFEKPVTADISSGHMEQACARLAAYAPEIERAYGDDNCQTWVLRIGLDTTPLAGLGAEVTSLPVLVKSVGAAVAGRLERRA
ncbi:type I-E CRISPR-associated protein Cas7/Cse4/CasC [Streptomyces sp. NPDC026673]|uniref:type I-E CRISPR-associated protein Cas7/Cse4/CasC n=1 Tax=Streptomyces sp. NPDC026673 TaxID=3155724 RepID=UPI0033C6BF1D